MRKRLRTLTIDRTKWGRNNSAGERSGYALRQNEKSSIITPSNIGKMCCLGFACSKLGVTDNELSSNTCGRLIGVPSQLPVSTKKTLPNWLLHNVDTDGEISDVDKLASANDNYFLSDTQKEKKIITIFAKHGVKVKFIN